MNVYDFDNTIYEGESVLDFYLYSVRKQPFLLKYLFVVLKTLMRYKLCRITTEELEKTAKKYARRYLLELKNKDLLVKTFWDTHQQKIKPFYMEKRKDDDVIISASVDFLLEEILERLGLHHFIATCVDTATGEVKHVCYRKNKVALFLEQYPDAKIENFYTDSLNDAGMMALAKHAYLVKGEALREIGEKEKQENLQNIL